MSESHSSRGEPDLRGRVLVVDDDVRACELISEILTADGYEVQVATDGPTALKIVRQEHPDTVLLDIMMPGMDGFEVCRRIKGDDATATVPVIFLTALTQREYLIRGISAGGDEFVSKPIDMDELLLRVRNAVRMHTLYDELNEHYEKLRRAEEWREQLFRMMAHDLKVPLAGALGNLDLVLEECRVEVAPETLECLSDAREAILRALRLAETVVDIGRLEDGRLPLKSSEHRLEHIVQSALNEIRALAEEKQITITAEGKSAPVRCDGELIQRVLCNLLDNAIAYSPAGERVHVRVQPQKHSVRVEVEDHGPGIPREWREKIFEKFTQVEAYARGRRFSKGLGLTFCKLAVEAHGGRIGVRSRVGSGSTFWFTLPVGGPHDKDGED